MVAVNNFFGFGGVSFGGAPADIVLARVMQNIVWTPAPGPVDVAATGLTVGRRYRLQMFFYEACCNRGFDVFVEGVRISDDFAPWVTQGGIAVGNAAAAMTYSFVAGDTTLNLRLIGPSPANPDNNPILDGFTLEDLGL